MEHITRVEKYLRNGEHYDELNVDIALLVEAVRGSLVDPLTHVTNRAGLIAEWPNLCGTRPAVALLDLDKFKPVNDTYGHAAGDAVLVEVAARLRACHCGEVVRLGGDEFTIILPCSLAQAVAILQRVLAVIARPIHLPSGVDVAVSASIGVHLAAQDLGAALARADAAMYRAKVERTGLVVYNPRCDRRPARHRPPIRLRDR